MFRLVSGRIVERWESLDALGVLQQLGVIPTRELATTYGVGEGGAVLVRPDGHVAWRCAEPRKALAGLLSPCDRLHSVLIEWRSGPPFLAARAVVVTCPEA